MRWHELVDLAADALDDVAPAAQAAQQLDGGNPIVLVVIEVATQIGQQVILLLEAQCRRVDELGELVHVRHGRRGWRRQWVRLRRRGPPVRDGGNKGDARFDRADPIVGDQVLAIAGGTSDRCTSRFQHRPAGQGVVQLRDASADFSDSRLSAGALGLGADLAENGIPPTARRQLVVHQTELCER